MIDSGRQSNKQADTSQTSNKEGRQLQGTKLNDFTPVADVTELQKTDLKVGTGDEVKPGDTVTVDYTGAVAATGIIFQSSLDSGQPVSFGLNQVIKGWTDGVPGMKVGGTRRLLIPAEMAYGANPPAGSGIPANAPLVFDITLHKVGN
jgi:FKBP-type peptidyl-prolyl cis-trans isomerase